MATSIKCRCLATSITKMLDNILLKQQIRHCSQNYHPIAIPVEDEIRRYADLVKEYVEPPPSINIGYKLQAPSPRSIKRFSHRVKPAEAIMDEENVDSEDVHNKLDELKKELDKLYKYTYWSINSTDLGHYFGIYKDLFQEGYFHPLFPLDIKYKGENSECCVHFGNELTHTQTSQTPDVTFEGDPNKFYTLVMSAPDSHLQDNSQEYVHWMVGNIPGGDVAQGEQLCGYLPPFPVRGTGYHRYVFVLYEHSGKVNFDQYKKKENCLSLSERTFNTFDFYSKYQEEITPVSLALFQSQWEPAVKTFFHKKLEMKEPAFEFVTPAHYHADQILYPIRQPFNKYLDRYRDIQEIEEEVLKEKIKSSKPFEPPPEELLFPNAIPQDFRLSSKMKMPTHNPRWLRVQNEHKRLRRFQWKGLDD